MIICKLKKDIWSGRTSLAQFVEALCFLHKLCGLSSSSTGPLEQVQKRTSSFNEEVLYGFMCKFPRSPLELVIYLEKYDT